MAEARKSPRREQPGRSSVRPVRRAVPDEGHTGISGSRGVQKHVAPVKARRADRPVPKRADAKPEAHKPKADVEPVGQVGHEAKAGINPLLPKRTVEQHPLQQAQRPMRNRRTWRRHTKQRQRPTRHSWPVRLFHSLFALNHHHLTLKRRVYVRVRTLLVVGCLGWVVFIAVFSPSAQPVTDNGMQTANATPVQATKPNTELYPDLPPAVANAISSVVAVQRVTGANNQGLAASGVILGKDQVLTAGHEIDSGNGVLACSQTSVVGPGVLTPGSASSNPVLAAALRHTDTLDMALLQIKSDTNFQALPSITIAQGEPESGSTVYFINFQPKGDGQQRIPTNKDASTPAVFSGTALGGTEKGFAIATGGGQSYGLDGDDNILRKGASGGAVVNEKGELLGLSVSSDSLEADKSAASLARMYGITLPAGYYQLAYVQPPGVDVVARLQASLAACH